MGHYLLYWRPQTVREMAPDVKVWYAWGKKFRAREIASSDVLWAITSWGRGDLRLVGRIEVKVVTASRRKAAAMAQGGPLPDDANEFAFGVETGSRLKQDIDISDIALKLVFEGGSNRLPRSFSGQNFQAIRQLTDESAELLEEVWAEEEGPSIGRRDPPWQRDELLLALDLYLRSGRKVLDEGHPDVIALSELLNRLPIHPGRVTQHKSRNPNAVALELANFRAIDEPGKGMARGNRLEQDVWDEFAEEPARLRNTAEAIALGMERPEAFIESDPEEETSAREGRLLLRIHRARERDPRIVKRKKTQVLRETGKLVCEACAFDFAVVYGSRGEGFIECHHRVPLADGAKERSTRLDDLVLVCANCHRILHRGDPIPVNELKKLVARGGKLPAPSLVIGARGFVAPEVTVPARATTVTDSVDEAPRSRRG